ncbi:MAG: Mitotic spindle assembly checkpoint protein MAD1 [Piccolia ochrophora]|nr:MAG: Mitotic spindle assembly checkpoint protein MAD1 [Piccolia ochrophora]
MGIRNANTQPSYDFLAGGSSPTSKPHPLRQSQLASAIDTGNPNLRAEVKALQYELETVKQERELVNLRHEKELRDAQKKAEVDFKRAQASESSSHVAVNKYEALSRELKEAQDQAANDRRDLEKKLRGAQERNQTLQEELEDAQTELSTQERQSQHRISELETKSNTHQRTTNELRDDLSRKTAELHELQRRLSQRDADLGALESEVLRLKAQTGDAETLGVIKRELSEQVAHIKKLETANRDQLVELKQYRKVQKSIEMVEEEKRNLESKLRRTEDLRRELSEVQLQKQMLEDERLSWTSYLQRQDSSNGDLQFDTPESLAKAFIQARLDNATLTEKAGTYDAELSGKDEIIRLLDEERSKLQKEVDKARLGGGGEGKVRSRLERQRALAIKEVQYLRAQLKTFDAEETTFQTGNYDEQKTKRIQELEDMVDQYRNELETLNNDLNSRDDPKAVPEAAGVKRPREEEPDERLGQLSRKNRKLQEELAKVQQNASVLMADLTAARTQLTAIQSTSRTRVLELRSNPTSDLATANHAALVSLRSENAALLSQLRDDHASPAIQTVPVSTLDNAQAETREMEQVVAEREKRMKRLKQIWAAKSLEFREAVASVLGWKMDFLPNGRVRVTSMFYPSDEEDGGEERSIVFDGENGTMKISGGEASNFKREIRNLVRFWVEERKEIPCFLAAATLEFYERTTRATRM